MEAVMSDKTKPTLPVEDEDFTIKVEVPLQLSLEQDESECNKECIRLEDKCNIYILPLVVQKAG